MSQKGSFKLKNKVNMDDITTDTILPESDYSLLTHKGDFVQFEYETGEKEYPEFEAKPGIWKIVKTVKGLDLNPASFVSDQILDEFVNTTHIEEVVDSFFNNIPLYKEEFGIEVAKRNLLLYGPPGTGKTTSITKCVNKYVADGKTLAITWDTSVLEAGEVKGFISSFKYVGVDKIIVVAEDIGGTEDRDRAPRTDAALLSILDNNDKTFTIPVMIIATTNHPANLSEALANRSGRFDDKIEAALPPALARRKLLEFYSKNKATPEGLALIESKECDKFSPAAIKDTWIRSRLRSKPLVDTIKEVQKDIKFYNDAFEKRNKTYGLNQ